jgi:hypothetical protein
VDAQTLEETRTALEELLTSAHLGGKAGQLMSSRSRFRGRTRDGELAAYVDFLIEDSGMRLGVCDWGYCVCRSGTAACIGDERGPNPLWRTESTCASYANFAVTDHHRTVWQAPSRTQSRTVRRSAPRRSKSRPLRSFRKKGHLMTKPHDRRMEATAEKLRAALDHLSQGDGQRSIIPVSRLTVAALAREAGVGQNVIYTNHRDILDDLIRARQRQRQPNRISVIEDNISEQRGMIEEIQIEIRQHATDIAGLMRRAIEAEHRADRAERRSALLTREVDALCRPMLLRSSEE